MKARKVFETMNFQRNVNPLKSMGLGGYSYDTLKPGIIIKAKKSFGVSASGNLGGYHSTKYKIYVNSYGLIISIDQVPDSRKKLISFLNLDKKNFDILMDVYNSAPGDHYDKIRVISDGIFRLTGHWWHQQVRNVFLSEEPFNRRFEIIPDE